MDVLFLGGPIDGQRLPVSYPLPETVCAANPTDLDEVTGLVDVIAPDPGVTHYRLRYVTRRVLGEAMHDARAGEQVAIALAPRSERRPVYVTADYIGPMHR